MDFRILGPIEIRDDRDTVLPPGRPRERALLGLLLVRRNRLVNIRELTDGLWPAGPPATAKQTVQVFVHGLRRSLGPERDRLRTRSSGYELEVRDGELDADRFGALLDAARAGADPEQAARRFAQAMELWRGTPLDGLEQYGWARSAAARLRALRLRGVVDQAQVLLGLGAYDETIRTLEPVVADYPVEEQPRAQLMRALAATGRRPEALQVYEETVRQLEAELGIGPGPHLCAAREDILSARVTAGTDAVRSGGLDGRGQTVPSGSHTPGSRSGTGEDGHTTAGPAAGAGPAANEHTHSPDQRQQPPGMTGPGTRSRAVDTPPTLRSAPAGRTDPTASEDSGPGSRPSVRGGPERKPVTSLAVGLTTPTGPVDPEEMLGRGQRLSTIVHAQVGRFGGTVVQEIGGTILAVFGVPETREDDPERAVRAGLAILEEAREAGLVARSGAASGLSLVTGADGADEKMSCGVTGQAAGLRQVAGDGELLVHGSTWELTRSRIRYRDAGDERWAAVAPQTTAHGREDGPFVGRDHERSLLRDLMHRTRTSRTPQLVTVLGAPGIGKSRLVAELATAAEAEAELITWRQGQCLPLFEGAPLEALAGIVRAHAGIRPGDSLEVVQERVGTMARALLPDRVDADWVTGHLCTLLRSGKTVITEGDRRVEALSAWRRWVEAVAGQRLTVLVVEDVHWADDGLLDFVDGLLDGVEDVPLLVVVTARPELLERRSDWGGRKRDTVTLSLAPLSPDETGYLVETLGTGTDEELRGQVVRASGGNPLFVEEYLRVLHDQTSSGSGSTVVPLSVQQVIGSRLDRLDLEDKALVQAAATVGEVAWTGAVAAATGTDRSQVESWLDRMTARSVVRRSRSSRISGEIQFSFRHAVFQEVAYGQLVRSRRRELHERVADWLAGQQVGGTPGLEAAARHYAEAVRARPSRADTDGRDDLLTRARHAFRAAGDQAAAVHAPTTAASWYDQAVALWPDEDPDLLLAQARTHCSAGSLTEAVFTRASTALHRSADPRHLHEAELLEDRFLALYRGQLGAGLRRAAQEAARRQEEALDEGTLDLQRMQSVMLILDGRPGEAAVMTRRAMAAAERLDRPDLAADQRVLLGAALLQTGDLGGVDHIEQAVRSFEATRPQEAVIAYVWSGLGHLYGGDLRSMHTDYLRAHELAAQHVPDMITTGGLDVQLGSSAWQRGEWAETRERCERFLASGNDMLGMASWAHGLLGLMALAQDGPDAALQHSEAALRLVRDPGAIRQRLRLEQALALRAEVMLRFGRTNEAARVGAELIESFSGGLLLPPLGRSLDVVLEAVGYPADALAVAVRRPTPWLEAACAYRREAFTTAATVYERIGTVPDAMHAWLRAAEQLLDEGHQERARPILDRVGRLARTTGAGTYLQRSERLLRERAARV